MNGTEKLHIFTFIMNNLNDFVTCYKCIDSLQMLDGSFKNCYIKMEQLKHKVLKIR